MDVSDLLDPSLAIGLELFAIVLILSFYLGFLLPSIAILMKESRTLSCSSTSTLYS